MKVKYKGQSREQLLKLRYGITVEQWNEMYDIQHGECLICLKPIFKPGNKEGRKTACVDHDHKTGRVRGLLCFRCNKYFVSKNTKETAERMFIYLTSKFDGREL